MQYLYNWRPPLSGCLKVNTDGAAFGSPGLAGCAGVFRTCRGFVKGCFAIPLGVCFVFLLRLNWPLPFTLLIMLGLLASVGYGWRTI